MATYKQLEHETVGWTICAVLGILAYSTPARAGETTTYSYDALGRVKAVAVAAGPMSGTSTSVSYDKLGNRATYEVAGSPNGPVRRRVVVVPLNGFTIIVLPGF